MTQYESISLRVYIVFMTIMQTSSCTTALHECSQDVIKQLLQHWNIEEKTGKT